MKNGKIINQVFAVLIASVRACASIFGVVMASEYLGYPLTMLQVSVAALAVFTLLTGTRSLPSDAVAPSDPFDELGRLVATLIFTFSIWCVV